MKSSINKYFTILIPHAFGFLLSCFFVSMNSMQLFYITKTIKISTVQEGWLTAGYFLGFVLAQLPVGILLDKYRPKHVFASFFIFSAVGLVLFALSTHVYSLTLSRFLIGVGASVPLVAALKANSDSFTPKNIPFVNGLTLFIGGFGLLIVGKPLNMYLQNYSWQSLNLILAILVFANILVVLTLSPSIRKIVNYKKTVTTQFLEIIEIIKNKQFLWLCFIVVVSNGFFISMITLWVAPWLKFVNNFTVNQVGLCISIAALGNIFGPLIYGYVGNLFSSDKKSLIPVILIGNLLFIAIQIIIFSNIQTGHFYLNIAAWLLFFTLGQAGSLGFACAVKISEPQYAGRALTILNMLYFFSAFLCQGFFGVIEHLFANRLSVGFSYRMSFGFFLILQILIVSFYLYKKYCKRALQIRTQIRSKSY